MLRCATGSLDTLFQTGISNNVPYVSATFRRPAHPEHCAAATSSSTCTWARFGSSGSSYQLKVGSKAVYDAFALQTCGTVCGGRHGVPAYWKAGGCPSLFNVYSAVSADSSLPWRSCPSLMVFNFHPVPPSLFVNCKNTFNRFFTTIRMIDVTRRNNLLLFGESSLCAH